MDFGGRSLMGWIKSGATPNSLKIHTRKIVMVSIDVGKFAKNNNYDETVRVFIQESFS